MRTGIIRGPPPSVPKNPRGAILVEGCPRSRRRPRSSTRARDWAARWSRPRASSGNRTDPRLKNGWPKAYTRPSSTIVTVPVAAIVRSPRTSMAPTASPALQRLGRHRAHGLAAQGRGREAAGTERRYPGVLHLRHEAAERRGRGDRTQQRAGSRRPAVAPGRASGRRPSPAPAAPGRRRARATTRVQSAAGQGKARRRARQAQRRIPDWRRTPPFRRIGVMPAIGSLANEPSA